MILVAGIPSERPLALVADALEASGADHRVLDQRRASAANLTLDIADADGGGAKMLRKRDPGDRAAPYLAPPRK